VSSITNLPLRVAAALAGVSLAVAGALAAGAPAVAAGRETGHHGGRAAAPAPTGIWPGRGGLGRPGLSVAALPEGGQNIPKPGKSSALNGVYCTSSTNCWAVGFYTRSSGGSELNEVLHWNGSKWSQVSVANPGGTGANHFSTLAGVRCLSAKDCWMVGYYSKGRAEFSQAFHWNGKSWSTVATPVPGGTLADDFTKLYDVVCASSNSCWAGGGSGTEGSTPGATTSLNEILHWNGKAWSLVHTPNPAGTGLGDGQDVQVIRCTSTRNCFAVGTFGNLVKDIMQNEVLHWNGSKWSKMSVINPGGTGGDGNVSELFGLGCTTASNCWAVGTFGLVGTLFQNEALQWNGRKWLLASPPNPGGTDQGASNDLIAVNCLSATNCWAVGYDSSQDPAPLLNQALHWNGATWSQSTTPDPAGTGSNEDVNELLGIRCTSASNCWAVGERERSGGSLLNQALRWNGANWSTG
jgi:hypothetical protein